MDVNFVTHKDPHDRFGALITYGERNIHIPDDALISITLGEQFSVWKTMVNAMISQFVMKQMKKSKGLLYAEMKGHIKEGYGLTLTV
ncbi:hypothetical protein ACFSCZ_17610 [Siminovitchia sediminis]|uniref:Uncharacterized protein n=1 Tax=Siminovitchia sediminis TaxID=1274353 RepID=A0ABW4KKG6_9BACI